MKLRTLPCTLAATLVLASLAMPSALIAQTPATPTPAADPAQTTTAAPAQASDTLNSPTTKPKKTPRSERAKQTKDV